MQSPWFARKNWTAFHFVGLLIIVVAIIVIVTAIFAPRKPDAPPVSAISYQTRPEKPEVVDDDSGDAPRHAARPEDAKKQAQPTPNEPACLVHGVVTERETGKPVARVSVTCREPDAKKTDEDTSTGRHYTTLTDKTGHYAIRTAFPAHYVVTASGEGYLAIKDQTLDLGEKAKDRELNFALSRGARISGKVTEAGTGKPAQGVPLGVKSISTSAHTDKDGHYVLSGLEPGAHEVEVRLRMGKAAYTISSSGGRRTVSITSPAQEVRGVDFVVDVAGEVWGYVLTTKQEPVTKAEIILCNSNSIFQQAMSASVKESPPPTGQTDAQGYYEIFGVPLNKEWRLYAATDQNAPQLSESFILTPAERVARVDLFLSNGTSVRGRVVSEDRKPIPDADVFCIPSYTKFFSALEDPQAFRPGKSEADGSFEITHLPPGQYQVLARKKGFKFIATGEPIYPNGITDIANVVVMLAPTTAGVPGSVFGTVTDSGGAVVQGANVSLVALSSEDFNAEHKSMATDAQGRFLFAGITPGFLKMMVQKEGFEDKDVDDVRLDEQTDVELEGSGSVKGVVLVRETGSPATGFTVRAIPAGNGTMSGLGISDNSATSKGADGSFTLQLGPGEYIIEARAAGMTPGQTSVSVSSGTDSSVTIYVSQRGGSITGHVRTVDGKSAAGADTWLSGGGADTHTQAGDDGSFAFQNLSAGTFIVFVQLEGYAQGQSGPVALGDNQTSFGADVVLSLGNALEGTVSFNGQLATGAIVTVTGNGANEITSTDSSGSYRIEKLAPGAYLVSAISFAGVFQGLPFALEHARATVIEGQTNTCNLGEPTNTALVGTCAPPVSGAIEYAVVHVPGMPSDIFGLNLFVMNMGGISNSAAEIANNIMGLAPVGADGYFRIDNLIGGQFELEIIEATLTEALTGKLHHIYSSPMTIADGQVMQIDLRPPEPTGKQ